MRVLGVEPPAGHDAVEMGMVEQPLSPGVQDGDEADLGAQAAPSHLGERLGDRGEEQAIGHSGAGQEEGVQLGGHGEDDMEVRHGQQIAFLGFPPARFVQPLTLGAMPIPTGVVGDLLVTAVITPSEVASESGRPAVGDGAQDLLLTGAQPVEVARVLPNDVGQFHAARAGRRSAHGSLSSWAAREVSAADRGWAAGADRGDDRAGSACPADSCRPRGCTAAWSAGCGGPAASG